MTHHQQSTLIEDEDKIDIIGYAKLLWNHRKFIIKSTFVFMLLGVFIAVFSENQYEASTTIVPQTGKKSSSGLSSIAALAGINVGTGQNDAEISPRLYPQVINNVSFLKELMETPLTIQGESQKVTYKEFYTSVYSPSILSTVKKYTIGLPGVILGLFKSKTTEKNFKESKDSLIYISKQEMNLIRLLTSQMTMDVVPKEGYIKLTIRMPEATAVAELTESAQYLLEKYVIDFKIKRSLEQLSFIKKRFKEKKNEFEIAQEKLASYTDRNQNINSARAKTEFMQLQSSYNLAFGIYSEITKQLEAQEIKVKQDTPIFTITEPAFVPLDRVQPNRVLIFIIWSFLGVLVSVGYLLGRNAYVEWKEKWLSHQG